LPWRHHQYLLDKLSDQPTREWYAAAAVENGWSRDVLALHIESQFHERAGKAITNFATGLPPEHSDLAQQATRDPYLFDFLSTTQTRLERDLEQGLIDHASRFLLELGQGFAFVGRQYRLAIGIREYHCDLLFYHLRLRRYVAIELKAVDFEPGFLSQLGMYMVAIDDLLATDGDQPTLGLLLCKSKDNVIAEYAVRSMAVPIGVAEWTKAITTSLPTDLTSSLPSIEELEAVLSTDLQTPPPPAPLAEAP
jgi:predicted nuclease of restriction endonuclease-like (RecB) superfamily